MIRRFVPPPDCVRETFWDGRTTKKENDNGMGFSAFVRNALREGISGVREAVENVRMKHVSPVGRRGAVNFVGSVAYCAMTLAGSGAVGAAGAPVVVRVVDPPARSTPTEAVVLAHRILQRESDALLVDPGQRRELAGEIELVLSRIRETYPTLADLTVRQRYQFGVLVLGLDPDLLSAVRGLLPKGGQVALHTGYEDFDALNARLGLSAVELYVIFDLGFFYFDESLNVGEATRAYEMVEGVEFAYAADSVMGDGSDIDAVKSQGIWHVAVRRAWGDCLSGCGFKEIFFFTVKGSDVERIERAQAMDMIPFVDLLKNTGWSGWEREMEIPPDDRALK